MRANEHLRGNSFVEPGRDSLRGRRLLSRRLAGAVLLAALAAGCADPEPRPSTSPEAPSLSISFLSAPIGWNDAGAQAATGAPLELELKSETEEATQAYAGSI